MRIKHSQAVKKDENELYLTIWNAEQEFSKTRWTVVTFFLGISFVILGYSFQPNLDWVHITIIRSFGIVVYWFTYSLYIHFYAYTKSLRQYLMNMENTGRSTLHIQSEIGKSPGIKRKINTKRLLFLFGIICSIGILILTLLKL